MARAYEGTQVPVGKSAEGIRTLLRKADGEKIVVGETMDDHLAVEWTHSSIRYRVELPTSNDITDAEERRQWRIMYWAIKSKIESVDSGMETYEVAFMGQIVDPASGRTLTKVIVPMVEAGVFDMSGQGLRALPAYTGSGDA